MFESPSASSLKGILPRLRLRAHYIDSIMCSRLAYPSMDSDGFPDRYYVNHQYSCYECVMFQHHSSKVALDYPHVSGSDHDWASAHFRKGTSESKKEDFGHLSSDQDPKMPSANLIDLHAFLEATKPIVSPQLYFVSPQRQGTIFTTKYNVGCTAAKFGAEDEIYAIDGACLPLSCAVPGIYGMISCVNAASVEAEKLSQTRVIEIFGKADDGELVDVDDS